MHALPKITNPLRPTVSRSWIPPIRFRTKPYLKLSQSLSEALARARSALSVAPRKTRRRSPKSGMTQRLRRKPR